jgi:hypothetical protein
MRPSGLAHNTCLPVVQCHHQAVSKVAGVSPPLEVLHQRVQELGQVGLVATGGVDGTEGVWQNRHLRNVYEQGGEWKKGDIFWY